jgi:hypothetical protein
MVKRWWGVVWFLLSVAMLSHAQSPTPLLVVVAGNLYRLDGEALVPYTECQPEAAIVDVPVVAPDNTTFALRMVAPDNDTLSNLWLCDHDTQTLEQITTLASLTSQPVFTLDSTSLLWSELSDEGGYRIGNYDIENATSPSYFDLPEIPEQANPESPLDIWVSSVGVHLYSNEFRDDLPVEVVYTYDVEGNYQGAVDVLTIQDPSWFTIRHWQNSDFPEFIILTSQGWYLVNLLSGETTLLEDGQLIRRPVGTDSEANIPFYTFENGLLTATPLEETTGTALFLALPETSIAQSSDGETIAYADIDLRLWERGAEIVIANTVFGDAGQPYLAWGAFQYGLLKAPIERTTLETCGGIVTMRLLVGDEVQLTSDSANNIRETPSLTGKFVGRFTANELATILAGPVCADGYAWYQVNAPAAIGWTAYGNATDTYLERP